MATMSISGVVSGMDWDSMIDKLIEKSAAPAQVQVSKRTNLQNKKSLFEEMKVMVQSIQSSMTSLKLPSTYKAKAVDIERIDNSGSHKGVLTATVNADAEINVYDIEVQSLATAQTNRSKQITASTIATTLSDAQINSTSSKMYINAGGQKVGIDVYSTDSLQSLKSRINNTVKTLETPLNVTASVVDNKLVIKSDSTGRGLTTTEETVTYNANGINTLQTISPDSSGKLTIRSGSKTYEEGTDYIVAGNHQIRWKQYDSSTEVALGAEVKATYTMGKDDEYTTSGTYGESEAKLGFSFVDGGNLSSRLTITDDESGKTYNYGTHFTINSDDEVEWLDTETYTNGEPSAYTVSLKKTTTTNATISKSKAGPSTPYTLSYTATKSGTVTIPASTAASPSVVWSGVKFNDFPKESIYSIDVIPNDPKTTRRCLDPLKEGSNVKEVTLTSTDGTSTTYEYGRDFLVWSSTKGDNTTYVTGKTDYIFATEYRKTDQYKNKYGTAEASEFQGGQYTVGVTYTMTYDSSKSDHQYTIKNIFDAAGDNKKDLVLTDANGNTYIYDKDYTIDDSGNIQWTDTGAFANDVISADDFKAIETAYRAKFNLDSDANLPTVTITGSDGVVRTYLDPKDKSAFTMTSGTNDSNDYKEYEYGRDYVIRVSDDGQGYTFSWLITGDKNNDGTTNINDANIEVKDYITHKNISTSGWLAAPSSTQNYTFSVSGTGEETLSADIKASGTDKGLASILKTTLSDNAIAALRAATPDENGVVKFTSTDGNITTEYELTVTSSDGSTTYPKIEPKTADSTTPGTTGDTATGSTGTTPGTTDGSTTGTTGTTTTGADASTDYVISYYIDENGNIAWNNDDTAKPTTGTFTITYIEEGLSVTTDAIAFDKNTSLLNVLGRDSLASIGDGLSITDSSGKSYTYNKDFTLNSDGTIHWTDDDPITHPSGSYTVNYKSYTESVVGSYSEGNNTYIEGLTGVTYDDILLDAKVSDLDEEDKDYQSKVDAALDKIFKLDDGAVDEETKKPIKYTCGTDYRIKADSDGKLLIEWLKDGKAPKDGAKLNITYSGKGAAGSETIVSNITRSATDSVIANPDDYDRLTKVALPPKATVLQSGTTTITYGSYTFYEGEDYTITADSDGYAQITWIADSEREADENGKKIKREWSYPTSGSMYTINHVDGDGNTKTYSGYRTSRSVMDITELGMKTNNGMLSVSYGGGLDLKLDDSLYENDGYTANDAVRAAYSFTVNESTRVVDGEGNRVYEFNWYAPKYTTRGGLPDYGADVTVEYEYEANSFTLSDDGDGLIDALGLNDEENVTEAHNAVILLDGNTIERDQNILSEDAGTEVIKGMVINLKGLGEVSLDVYHDAEKAVEAITTFKDNYNDLMTWMNTRMTESAVDNDTAATVDSDDFRMRWGLLHGNALLRNTKSNMRSLTSQTFTYNFTQRTSAEEIYGTFRNNGLNSNATLRIRINGTYSDITLQPGYTLQDLVDKINDSSDPEMRNMYYDSNGKLLEQPLIKASINEDKLVLSSTDNNSITLSGTAAMKALKMNYTYTGLFQLGLATTSTDYGKSGELEFDESKFMEALEDNADEVQELMLMFSSNMDTWLKSMLTSSSSGETSGTLTRQIEDLDKQIKNIDDYLEDYQDRLDRQEEALRTKFAAAEQSISKMSQQASALASILAQLSGSSSSSSSSVPG